MRGRPIKVWFQDEAQVGQQGTLNRVRADRGTRPHAPRDTGYRSACIFRTVCPDSSGTAARVMPQVDTAGMNAHPVGILTAVVPGATVIPVLDGAGRQGPKTLQAPDNMTLLPRPPHAPKPTPVKNIPACLRANQLAIPVFDTHEQIVEACCQAWNIPANDPEAIHPVTSRECAKTVTPKGRRYDKALVHHSDRPSRFEDRPLPGNGIAIPVDQVY